MLEISYEVKAMSDADLRPSADTTCFTFASSFVDADNVKVRAFVNSALRDPSSMGFDTEASIRPFEAVRDCKRGRDTVFSWEMGPAALVCVRLVNRILGRLSAPGRQILLLALRSIISGFVAKLAELSVLGVVGLCRNPSLKDEFLDVASLMHGSQPAPPKFGLTKLLAS